MQDVVFGPFQLDLKSVTVQSGATLKLQPQPARLLSLLVSRAGQLVTREEIRSQLWDSETFVDFDQSVNFCIRQIREFATTMPTDHATWRPSRGVDIGSSRPRPSAIESNAAPAPMPEAARAPVPGEWRRRPGRAFLAVAAVGAIVALTVAFLYWTEPRTPVAETVWLAVLPFEALDGPDYFADGMTGR